MNLTAADDIQQAIREPEVQDMLRRLAGYGLGICVPHAHGDGDSLESLPADLVQYEEDLRVSFIPADDPRAESALPVAWTWDGAARVVGRCRQGHGE